MQWRGVPPRALRRELDPLRRRVEFDEPVRPEGAQLGDKTLDLRRRLPGSAAEVADGELTVGFCKEPMTIERDLGAAPVVVGKADLVDPAGLIMPARTAYRGERDGVR